MIIVADKNIPFVNEAFSELGELHLVDGRQLSPADIKQADVLLVRSVSQVNAALLDGSQIRFVGSATSGIDHIDTHYLQSNNIQFAHTPGNNAQAVTEFVVSAMITLANQQQLPLAGKTLGVVGYGHIGSRVVKIAQLLGMKCLINDPPLAENQSLPDIRFESLDRILPQVDILTLHAPLNRDGKYPSYHLLNKERLAALKEGAWVINTARGGIIDSQALLAALTNTRLTAILDVWEAEPAISTALLEQAAFGTPHIAGYSLEGKLNATTMLQQALSQTFSLNPHWRAPLNPIRINTELSSHTADSALPLLIKQIYNIRDDDQRLRQLLKLPESDRTTYFDELRINYHLRREFGAYQCKIPADLATKNLLLGLGFNLLN